MTTVRIIDNNNIPGETVVNGYAFDDLSPKLSGSEKQVKWANDIIRENYAALCQEIAKAMAKRGEISSETMMTKDDAAKLIAEINKALATADAATARKTDASWWITNRFGGTGIVTFRLASK